MRKLTARQAEVLSFIESFIEKNSYPPCIREVAENFNISVKAGHDHIKALKKKNAIQYSLRHSRSIQVVNKTVDLVASTRSRIVPLLGTVAAGMPIFSQENFEGNMELPASFIGKGRLFAVHVRGDSMRDAGILDGDIAVIKHQEFANNGEIVVAMMDEALTIKRFYKEKNRIQLKPENSSYPPIYTQDAKILGRLACIIRKY